MKIRIAGIAEDSIVDGPGLRMTVFVQGCPHHCPGCHNPETHDYTGGTEIEVDEIVKQYLGNPLLDGITLSGGEPFDQPEACAELLSKVYHKCGSVWCYTGYTFDYLLTRTDFLSSFLLESIDVLVDGPYIESRRTLELPWRGSRNQRLIDVQKSLKSGTIVEWEVTND